MKKNMILTSPPSSGVDSSGVDSSGVDSSGVDASGVDASGVLLSELVGVLLSEDPPSNASNEQPLSAPTTDKESKDTSNALIFFMLKNHPLYKIFFILFTKAFLGCLHYKTFLLKSKRYEHQILKFIYKIYKFF